MLQSELRGAGQLPWISSTSLREDLIILAPDVPVVRSMLSFVGWPANRTRFIKPLAGVR
jgi:hypothetical protein